MFFRKKDKIGKVMGEEPLNCPRCNIKMEKLKKGDIIIDVCKKCKGMWLDAGEMEKLANMAQQLKKSDDKMKKGDKDAKKR